MYGLIWLLQLRDTTQLQVNLETVSSRHDAVGGSDEPIFGIDLVLERVYGNKVINGAGSDDTDP